MIHLRSVVIGCVLAVGLLLVGLGAGLVDAPQLGLQPTASKPGGPTPAACPAALIEGTLVASPGRGIVLRVDGEPDPVLVTWPDGWVVRGDGTSATLVDETGRQVAAAGDRVTIGGGFTSEAPGARRWLGCGGVTVIAP